MPSANYTDDDIRLAFEYEEVQKYVNEALKATHYASRRDWNAAVRWYRDQHGGDFNEVVRRRDELKRYFGGKNASQVVQGLSRPPQKPVNNADNGQNSSEIPTNPYLLENGTLNFRSIYDGYMKVASQGMKDRLKSILDIYSIEDIEEAFMNRWNSRYVPPPVVPQTPVVIYQGAVPNYDRGGYSGVAAGKTGSSSVAAGKTNPSVVDSGQPASKNAPGTQNKPPVPQQDKKITYGSREAIKGYIENNPKYSWFENRHSRTIEKRVSSLLDLPTAYDVRYYINRHVDTTGGKRYPEAEYYLAIVLNENNNLPTRKQSLNTFLSLMKNRYGERISPLTWDNQSWNIKDYL